MCPSSEKTRGLPAVVEPFALARAVRRPPAEFRRGLRRKRAPGGPAKAHHLVQHAGAFDRQGHGRQGGFGKRLRGHALHYRRVRPVRHRSQERFGRQLLQFVVRARWSIPPGGAPSGAPAAAAAARFQHRGLLRRQRFAGTPLCAPATSRSLRLDVQAEFSQGLQVAAGYRTAVAHVHLGARRPLPRNAARARSSSATAAAACRKRASSISSCVRRHSSTFSNGNRNGVHRRARRCRRRQLRPASSRAAVAEPRQGLVRGPQSRDGPAAGSPAARAAAGYWCRARGSTRPHKRPTGSGLRRRDRPRAPRGFCARASFCRGVAIAEASRLTECRMSIAG